MFIPSALERARGYLSALQGGVCKLPVKCFGSACGPPHGGWGSHCSVIFRNQDTVLALMQHCWQPLSSLNGHMLLSLKNNSFIYLWIHLKHFILWLWWLLYYYLQLANWGEITRYEMFSELVIFSHCVWANIYIVLLSFTLYSLLLLFSSGIIKMFNNSQLLSSSINRPKHSCC